MSAALHPDQVLFEGCAHMPAIPAVDHYAGSEKLMRKAMALQADNGPLFDITFDCEDGAVAGSEKDHAQLVGDLICSKENRFERIGVRIHDVTNPSWLGDLRIILQVAGARVAFVTLPKARSYTDVERVDTALTALEQTNKIARRIPLHVLVETHGALKDVFRIAGMARVVSLDFGLMDFVSEHAGAIPATAMKTPGQFEHPLVHRAKCEIAAAALANGCVPTHNVSTELMDMAQVENDAKRAREQYGFLRMWSIHPNQIEAILRGMRPDFSEVEAASSILTAAQDADWGPIRADNRLHDRASYRYYWSLLKRAKQTGMPLPSPIEQRFFVTRH